jgi:hypothetical protein
MSRWVFRFSFAAIVLPALLLTSGAAHAQTTPLSSSESPDPAAQTAATQTGAAQPAPANVRRDVGTLRITVVDETGAAIVDSPVRIWSEKGVDRTVQTSQRGEAIFENLAPGKYAVHVESIGFDAQDFEQNVRRGNTNKQITLSIASFVEQVDVTRDETEKALNDAFSTQLTQEQIDQLPDDADEMAEVLEQMAGPGARLRVNGFQGGRLPPKSQIAEIRFRFDPFSADNHEGGSPRIDIRTRPGNGEWRNSMTLTFRDDSLNARNAKALERGDEASQRAMWTVDGPIVKGKTSFSLAVGGLNSYDTETITSLRSDRTGLNTIEQPNDRLNIEARVEHALSKNHMLRAELQQNGNKQQNLGVGGFTEEMRAFSQERDETTFRISENGSIKGRFRNELRFEFNHENMELSSATPGVQINVLDQFNIGGAQRSGGRRTREIEIADDFDFTIGKKHAMRTGIEMESSWLRGDELSNNVGTFTFSSLADYNALRPRQYRVRQGNPLVEYSNTEFAWYINDDIRVRKNVMLNVGLRYEVQSILKDRNNFAPRAHVTWSPFKSAKTTLRAGAGVFYDWYDTGLYEDTLRVNGINQRDIIINQPCYPDPLACGSQEPTNPSVIQAAAYLVMPTVTRFSVGFEHQLTSWMGVRGNLFRQHGTNQFRSLNVNAKVNGVRPVADLGNISQIESIGEAKNIGVEVSANFNYQPRRMFSFLHYTYARSSNDGDGASSLPADSNNLAAEWGPAQNDLRHRLMWGINAPIAFGFRTNFSVRYQSATPYTITTGFDLNDDGVFSNDRPAGVSRNSARGDDALTMDLRLSWSKGFGAPRTPIGPGGGGPVVRGGPGGGGGRGGGGGGGGRGGGGGPVMMMMGPGEQRRFNVEIFTAVNNLTNAVNYGGYSGVLTSPAFGLPNSAQPARRIELGTRLGF